MMSYSALIAALCVCVVSDSEMDAAAESLSDDYSVSFARIF